MTAVPFAAATLALLIAPAIVDARGLRARASPTALVALDLVALGGLFLVPLAVMACLALLGFGHPRGDSVWLGVGAAAVAGLIGGRAGLAALRIRRVWGALESASTAGTRDRSERVAVLPTPMPVAVMAGRAALVGRGLLDCLSPEEAEAVLAHERSHATRGHARVAALAHALRRGAFDLALARRAERRLRHNLEVQADEDAARMVGNATAVASALDRLSKKPGVAGILHPMGSPVSHRLARLLADHRVDSGADRFVTAATVVVAVAALSAVCGAAHAEFLWLGLVACGFLVAVFWVTVRPLTTFPTA